MLCVIPDNVVVVGALPKGSSDCPTDPVNLSGRLIFEPADDRAQCRGRVSRPVPVCMQNQDHMNVIGHDDIFLRHSIWKMLRNRENLPLHQQPGFREQRDGKTVPYGDGG